jgi:hypothetical protein
VLDAMRDVDVRPLLPRVLAPTLVLHRRLDRAVRVEAGRYVASHIHGARFIELEGADHWFFTGAQEPVIEAIRRFVADLRPSHGHSTLRIVLVMTGPRRERLAALLPAYVRTS